VAGDYVCRLTGFSFPAPPVRNNLYLFLHHVAELVGAGSVPVNFVAGAFAADVRHPRITSFGTFTAVVNNQWGGPELLLATQQANLMFRVNTSGPTVGGEQLTVTKRRIAGGLRWYIADFTEAEVPARGVVCPEQSYREVCDLSLADFGACSVDIWVFFTPPSRTLSALLPRRYMTPACRTPRSAR